MTINRWFQTALMLACAPAAFGAACLNDTLANYVLLGAPGCTVNGEVVNNFKFSVVSASGGYTALNSGQINVLPTFAGSKFSVGFFSTGFSVTGAEFAHYEIDFTWDPVVFGGEDEMITHTPTFPGIAKVTTQLCAGSTFGGLCPPATNTLTVFHNGVSPHLIDFTSFAPQTLIGTQSFINLDANGASANMDGFITSVLTPEPAFGVLTGLTLLGLAVRSRRSR